MRANLPDEPVVRRVERRAGRFVSRSDGSPHEHGHFEIDTVPGPPRAERVLVPVDAAYGADYVERVEITSACPKCFCELRYRFEAGRASMTIVEEIVQHHDATLRAAVRRDREKRDWMQRHERVERHLFRFEERDDA